MLSRQGYPHNLPFALVSAACDFLMLDFITSIPFDSDCQPGEEHRYRNARYNPNPSCQRCFRSCGLCFKMPLGVHEIGIELILRLLILSHRFLNLIISPYSREGFIFFADGLIVIGIDLENVILYILIADTLGIQSSFLKIICRRVNHPPLKIVFAYSCLKECGQCLGF